MGRLRRVVVALLLMTGSAAASGAWVTAGGLFMQATLPDTYYALIGGRSDANPQGTQIALRPSYSWGFELGAGLSHCQADLQGRWNSLNATYHSSTQAPPGGWLWASLTFGDVTSAFLPGLLDTLARIAEGKASAKDRHKWDQIDGNVGWTWQVRHLLLSRCFIGVRYACFQVDRTVEYFNFAGILDSRVLQFSSTTGVGPAVGLSASYDICWGLGLTGEVSSSLMVGISKGQYATIDIVSTPPFVGRLHFNSSCLNDPTPIVIPNLSMRFGFTYRQSLCQIELSSAVEYQIQHYSQGVRRTLYDFQSGLPTSASNASNSTPLQPYTLAGWIFRVGAKY